MLVGLGLEAFVNIGYATEQWQYSLTSLQALDRSTDIHGLNTHLRVSFKHSASYRLCEQSLANFFQTGKSER